MDVLSGAGIPERSRRRREAAAALVGIHCLSPAGSLRQVPSGREFTAATVPSQAPASQGTGLSGDWVASLVRRRAWRDGGGPSRQPGERCLPAGGRLCLDDVEGGLASEAT